MQQYTKLSLRNVWIFALKTIKIESFDKKKYEGKKMKKVSKKKIEQNWVRNYHCLVWETFSNVSSQMHFLAGGIKTGKMIKGV